MINSRYEIMGRIGTGGMADVYKANDCVLNRYVAIKVLKSEFREDDTFVKKFRSEAQAAARLSHPNIVNVYDVGEDRGLYYIVMELVEGITLKEYIKKKGQLSTKEVIGITLQVSAGIEAAHNNGIIHRDIKPQNIIISREGKVKVTDFGIAKATTSNTISTNAMGSVHYTSPEQARGGFSDAKSDIYSLGITMYEMITGRLPFDGDSTVAIALKHLQEDIVAPSEYVPDMPYSLERIILKCTQKSPDRRYGDIGQLVRDLKRSISEPDGDFVVIAPFVSADTVMVTQEELERIQREAEYDYEGDAGYDENYDNDDRNRDQKKQSVKKRSEIDPKMAKVMRILTIVAAVIFAFILIFAVGNATGLFRIGPGIGIEQTEKGVVPELEGLTEEEAKEQCEAAGLEMRVVDRTESEKYDAGLVDSQKTAPKTKMPEGAVVQVVISTGLKGEEIEIPDVKNLSEDAAIDKLVEAGFKEENIEIITREDDEVDAGKAVGTTPEVGTMASEKTEIKLIMSEGVGESIVPKLVGKTKAEAEKALAEAGLVGNPQEVYSDKPADQVIAQSIEDGEKIEKGTKIDYVVSKGEEPPQMVTVPTGLVGETVSSVKATLGNMDIVPKVQYAESTAYAEGYVIGVEGEGTEVEAGSTVVITVSTGPGPSEPNVPENPTDAPTDVPVEPPTDAPQEPSVETPESTTNSAG